MQRLALVVAMLACLTAAAPAQNVSFIPGFGFDATPLSWQIGTTLSTTGYFASAPSWSIFTWGPGPQMVLSWQNYHESAGTFYGELPLPDPYNGQPYWLDIWMKAAASQQAAALLRVKCKP